MAVAINLDDEAMGQEGEVGDVGTDGCLAADMKALRFQTAKMRPEGAFLKGLVASQVPRPLPGLIRDPAHPAPLPSS